VIPVYKNAGTLVALRDRLVQTLAAMPASHEIIFVNDACPERSLAVLEEMAAHDATVSVIDLVTNVGQHQAVIVGLAYAQGQSVVVMDADLQDPPEAIPKLLTRLGPGCDAVFAGRRGRYQSGFRLFTSRMFKRVLHWLSGVPPDAGIFVALSRNAVNHLLDMEGPRPFVVAMIGCTNLPMASIPVERNERSVGASAYSSRMRLKSAWRGIWWTLCWKRPFLRRFLGDAPAQPNIRANLRARSATDASGDQAGLVAQRSNRQESE
jgi:glycosyltransferase involved in cell wall biosynthesis